MPRISSTCSNSIRYVEGKPASTKSKAGSAPASFMNQTSPPAPVPVILAEPTFSPEDDKPLIRLAAVVVLPAFIVVPVTTTVIGCCPLVLISFRAKLVKLMAFPWISPNIPRGVISVGLFIILCLDKTCAATPPAATR